MSSIEERLARDIEAVTGGVVVTQADVEQARERVEERIERTGRDRRRWTVLAAAATAAAVVGVGAAALTGDPAGDTDPADSPENYPWASFLKGDAPTEESVRGVWRVDNGMTLVRFTADNGFAIDTRGQITTPEIAGSYAIDGNEIVVDLGEGNAPSCNGEVGFRASVVGPGEMRMVADDAATESCGLEQSGRWVLEHVLPTSREMVDLGPPDDGAYSPLRESVLPGFWLVVGGGHGLQLTTGNTYYVLGEAGQVIELGQWWLEGDSLMLESEQLCRLGISSVQRINPGTDMLRGELTEYRCEMPWVHGDVGDTMAWFQLPDRTSS